MVHFISFILLAMPFAFCTREKHPWTQFAESAETGASTMFLADVGLSQKVIKLSLLVVFAAGGPAQDGDCVADPGEG